MAIPDDVEGTAPTLDMKKIIMELQGTPYQSAVTSNLTEWNWNDVVGGATLNTNSTKKPTDENGSIYSMNDWKGYDHFAAPSFVNAKAVSKTISTGSSNAITFTDTDDTFNFTSSSAWTISFWVKAGWNSSLNTNIHFIIGQKTNATYQLSDMVKILYNESNNRLECRYGNKTTSSDTWYKNAAWLFHSNSGVYAAGYAAAGLGATYWSASNRGNVNSDNYTLITVTKSTTDSPDAMTLYWNANSCGTSAVDTTSGTGSPAMSSTNDRLWSIGSNGVHGASNDQIKTGNSTATVYNDVTIWNKQLSASEVSELYNSGTVMNAETHSASSNLIGYWKFEGNGNATTSNDNFTISGGSAIVNK